MSSDALEIFYSPLSDYFQKAMSDLIWSLDNFMKGAPNESIRRIYDSSRKSSRVKTKESLLRKCRSREIATPDRIPEAIEDLIGIRIVTPNKSEAEALFDFFRSNKDKWFCDVMAEPKFTPYTIAERNRWSMSTGYQAFHMAFVYIRSYRPGTEFDKWPVEIQITSQLWEFWASYSRKYFYTASGDMVQKLRPYMLTIAKALDNAEDLIATTVDILLAEEEHRASASEGGRAAK